MGLIGVDQSWLPTLPAFAVLPNSSCPAQIFYAKNCRKAISVGDQIFNTRRDDSCLLLLKIRSPTLIAWRKSLASTTWVRIRLLEHGDLDRTSSKFWNESESIINTPRVPQVSCSDLSRDVKRWWHGDTYFLILSTSYSSVLVPFFLPHWRMWLRYIEIKCVSCSV